MTEPPSQNDRTEKEPPAAHSSSCEQSLTRDFPAERQVEDDRVTVALPPESNKGPEGCQGNTLDYAPESSADVKSTLIGDAGSRTDSPEFSVDSKVSKSVAGSKNQVVAGYEILGTLGRGAMGVVYKARQRGLRRVVALKMILAGRHASDYELNRFRTEAEAVAQLQHPNIVQVYEVGEHDGCPFLSLEFVDGESLKNKLAGTPQPVLQAAELVRTLAQTMDFAHRKGIIHRDLKPANVLLQIADCKLQIETQGDATSEKSAISNLQSAIPKIADFGLAKRLEEDGGQTRSGTILGTPSYMAPEQARGRSKDVGPLADQYALGAILYEMLTGTPPFRGETVWDTLEQVRTQEPVPPSQLQPKVPRDLETICLKALQKEPLKRYADCAALAEDLRRFIGSEPILARPVSAPERLWRWCRRNPKMALLAGFTTLLLVGVSIISTVSAILINKEKDRAERNARDAREAQAVAAEQAELALNTVRDLVGRVQTKLQETPATRGLRAEIIEMAMERVKQVADAGARNAGLNGRVLAAAHTQMGSICLSLNRPRDARLHYEEAFTILNQLAAENPDSDKAQGNLAVALANLGDLKLRLDHDVSAARACYERALRLRRDIHDHPRNGELPRNEVKRSLAGSYESLTHVTNDPEEVRRFQEAALNLRKEAAEIAPGSLDDKHDLFRTYLWFADTRAKDGLVRDALVQYDLGLKLANDLVAGNPKSVSARSELCHVLGRSGEMHLRLGEPNEARRCYLTALKENELLLKSDPSNEPLRFANAEWRYGLATAHLEAGDPNTALAEYRKALQFWEDRLATQPNNRAALTGAMLCAARCGEHVRAAQLADQVKKQHPQDPGNLVLVASAYALCTVSVAYGNPAAQSTPAITDLQRQYQTLALDLLRQARERGYKNWAEIETDPDFAPLQNNSAFKSLLDR